MRCLFFEHRGLVDITGATYDARTGKGEFGWYGPQGGVFTTALTDALLFSPLRRSTHRTMASSRGPSLTAPYGRSSGRRLIGTSKIGFARPPPLPMTARRPSRLCLISPHKHHRRFH